LCGLCCSCCAGIQIARHTHDERRYPYNACSQTGLPSWAPELWEDLLEDEGPPNEGASAGTGTGTGTGTGRNQQRQQNEDEAPMSNVEIV
jgi:hypothetical protein